MMLALGMFVFERRTLPYQNLQRNANYSWATNSRVGKRNAFQFMGAGEEKITVTGALYPEITGGRVSCSLLRLMAEQGRAWPLLDGNGLIYGMYVIASVNETGTEFFSDGTPRKIDFTLTLTRVDESLVAMFGDIRDQTELLVTKAGDAATRVMSSMGIG